MRELYLAPSGPLFGCRINKLAVPARLQDRSSAPKLRLLGKGLIYPRRRVIVAPRTSACASFDLIETACLSPVVTRFRSASNDGPFATTRKPAPSTLPDRVPAALREDSLQFPVIAPAEYAALARRSKL